MTASLEKPSKHLALLRGINVGGKNMLPMKELAKMFTSAGAENVQTYIQSGNVIFESTSEVSTGLPELISGKIAKRFGCNIPVVMRTVQELESVMTNNPFLKPGMAAESWHAMFLADLPDSANVAKLDPKRSAPDEFIVCGREVYLKLPNGVARTKLTNAYFDSKLATVSTSRNWRTITKLLELMKA